MAKVTGIGGVFFKSTGDREALVAWYKENLGIQLEEWGGTILRWADDQAEDKGLTVLQIAAKDSEWFKPSSSSFMINYRVDNMAEMLVHLHANGVAVIKGPDYAENGVFAWVVDPDGNKVELWEPKIWNDENKR